MKTCKECFWLNEDIEHQYDDNGNETEKVLRTTYNCGVNRYDTPRQDRKERHRDISLDKFACVSFKTADAPPYQGDK